MCLLVRVAQFMGSVQDGINSLQRYYLNNFQDGHKQDALDLFHGRYVPDKTQPSPFKAAAAKRTSLSTTLLKVAVFLAATFVVWGMVGPHYESVAEWTPSFWPMTGLFVLVQGFASWQIIKSRGRKFVNKPCLVPVPDPPTPSQ